MNRSEKPAPTWSARMVSRGLQHGSWTLVDQSGYETLGENIGRSSGTAANAGAVHSSWMNSDMHRALMLESGFDSVGDLLGVAQHGSGRNVYVIRFHYLPPGGWDRTV